MSFMVSVDVKHPVYLLPGRMPCIYFMVMPSPVAKLTIAHLHAQVCVSSIKLVTLLCSRNEGPAEKSVTEWNSEPVDKAAGHREPQIADTSVRENCDRNRNTTACL